VNEYTVLTLGGNVPSTKYHLKLFVHEQFQNGAENIYFLFAANI